MRELKATDKITQKMTRDGAVSENLATGEVEHISSREPETELSASSEESAGAAADLALRAAEHHEKKSARKAEKAKRSFTLKKWRNAPTDACGTIRFLGRSMRLSTLPTRRCMR